MINFMGIIRSSKFRGWNSIHCTLGVSIRCNTNSNINFRLTENAEAYAIQNVSRSVVAQVDVHQNFI